jgi:hypothetical protein
MGNNTLRATIKLWRYRFVQRRYLRNLHSHDPGQAYKQIRFFEGQLSFDEFTKGNIEFGVDVNTVAVTAAVGSSAGTMGAAGASRE